MSAASEKGLAVRDTYRTPEQRQQPKAQTMSRNNMRRKWLGYKTSGGEGGILLPPFLLSSCDAYTSVIIPCV